MSRLPPFFLISPSSRAGSIAVAVAALIWALACLAVPMPGEKRDWVFFLAYSVVGPLVFLSCQSGRTRWVARLGIAYFILMVFDGVKQLVPDIHAKLDSVTWEKNGFGWQESVLAWGWSLVTALLHFGVCYAALSWMVGKSLSRKEKSALFLLALPLFCLREYGPFFWLAQLSNYWVLWSAAILGAGLLVWFRTLWRSKGGVVSERWDWIDLAWLVVFLFLLRLPLTAEPGSLNHHWGYYLGPIETVQAGGILLYDAPSQYGFLSILLPALMPFSAGQAFWVALGLLLSAQFVLVYALLRSHPLFNASRVLPALSAFAFVLFLGGARNRGLGIFEAPSTSAYRFLWAFGLAVALASTRLGARPAWRNSVLAALFAVGVLWSGESAVYCIAVLVAAWWGQSLACVFHGRATWKVPSWVVLPTVSAALAVGLIELVYRGYLGIAPDWWAFIEYPLVYGGGFGSMPLIFFSPACAAAILVLGLGGYFQAREFLKPDNAFSSNLFGCWGFLIATFTYYISRSHPSNVLNLLCYYIPLHLFLFRRQPDFSSDRILRAWSYCLLLAVILCAFPHFPAVAERLWSLAKLSPVATVEPLLEDTETHEKSALLLLPKEATLLDFASYFPELHPVQTPYRPLYPVYPVSEFFILGPKRRDLYLTRSLTRHPRTIHLFHFLPDLSERIVETKATLEKNGYRFDGVWQAKNGGIVERFAPGR